jgi:tRNA pseudouridine55 synthase
MSGPPADGLLLVDKPSGVTSHDVVDIARRGLGERRIGHAGTLDPFATGLLVLLVGRATRLMPYVDGEPKVYEATIQFGAETDTDDPTGERTTTAPLPQRDAVERAIAALTGAIDQVPPAYSAKQVGGRRAYTAARRGEPLVLSPVRIAVHEWSVRDFRPESAQVTITCTGGTYVRALARDLGRLAGSAAHLASLRRTRSGPFEVADAVPLDALRGGTLSLRPPLDALPTLAVDTLDESGVARVRHGMPVPASAPGARGALVDQARALVAVAERVGDQWQPRVVLRDA